MNQIHTDPQTGRQYEVGSDGVSRWVDQPPPPPAVGTDGTAPFVEVKPTGRRHTGRWIAAAMVAVLLGAGGWALPTAGRCEDQINAEIVKALQAPNLKNYQFDSNKTHYWRCYGQSDESIKEIGQKVLARHWAELLSKGLSEAFGTPSP